MKAAGEHLPLLPTAEQNCKTSWTFGRGGDCPRGHGAAKSLDASAHSIVLPASQHTALSKRLQLCAPILAQDQLYLPLPGLLPSQLCSKKRLH